MKNIARGGIAVRGRGVACWLLRIGLAVLLARGTAPAAAGVPQGRLDAYGDPLPAGAVARMGTVRFLPRANAYAIALSPDGRLVASGTIPGTEKNVVEIWDAASGARIHTLCDGTFNILSLAFSPGGEQLAVSHAARVEVFDTAAWKAAGAVEQVAGTPEWGYESVRWSPDGRYLAAARTRPGTVALWKTVDLKLARSARYGQDIHGVAFSRDSQLLAIGGKGVLETHRVSDFALRMKAGVSADVQSVAFSPDGKTLAGAVRLVPPDHSMPVKCTSCVRLWDAETGGPRGESTAFKGDLPEVAYLRNGRTVVAIGWWGRAVHGWDAATLREQWTLEGPGYIGRHLALSADGRTMATADCRIAVWDLATGKQRHSWATHSSNVFSAVFTPDGATVLSAGADGVRCWDAASGRFLRSLAAKATKPRCPVAISRDGRTLATGVAGGREIALWAWPSGEPLGNLSGHKQSPVDFTVQSLDFAPGDAVLVSGGYDRSLRFWDVANRQQSRCIDLPQPVVRVRVSPDGKIVAAAPFGSDVTLFEAEGGKRLGSVPESAHMFFGPFDFLPTGSLLVVPKPRSNLPADLAAAERKKPVAIRLWDYRKEQELWSSEPLALLNVIAVSHNGRLVATGGLLPDDSIGVFSAKTGRRLAEFRGHADNVRAIAFSPGDSRLLTASQDGTLLVWQVPPVRDE
jgi:WD40 repeat protein